jgi:hypothetical protein
MKRYRFIWWGWRDMNFGFGRFVSSLSAVYVWWLYLGPLEIRKWKARS